MTRMNVQQCKTILLVGVSRFADLLRSVYRLANMPLMPPFYVFLPELKWAASDVWPGDHDVDDPDTEYVGPLACTAAFVGDVVALLGFTFVAVFIGLAWARGIGFVPFNSYEWLFLLGVPASAISPFFRYAARSFELNRRQRLEERYWRTRSHFGF